MDYYLEFIFPEKRVRYIAVAENEDTEKVLSDFVPFKNLFNEWFAKDTSRKVKDALRTKFKNKERVCAYAILGYKKDPSAKNRIIPDEETKQAVRRDMKWHAVFRLAAALMLSAALVYVSRVLDLHGIYGWPQGCTMGMLPFTGWLAGDAVFTLRQIKKL